MPAMNTTAPFPYDFLVVGAGISGATFAQRAVEAGKKVLVLERRDIVGGNSATRRIEGIDVHEYGAHIFHTSDERVWDYARRFARFNHYVNSPIARYKDEVYNLPFNMNTFSRMFGIATPAEAKARIDAERGEIAGEPKNLEEQAISLVGRTVYEKLVKGYTEKQWGRPCSELPAFIIRRLPVRFTYDNNFYPDPHQGIPVDGYTAFVEKLLEGADVRVCTDFFSDRDGWLSQAPVCIYTGPIDRYFDYRLGRLEYRSLRFETEVFDMPNYQGNAVVNYTASDVPWTRVIEHKHFVFGTQPKTIVTKEYPAAWSEGMEPYYPVNDARNGALCADYQTLAAAEKSVRFLGRLARYSYLDIDDAIAAALELADELLV